MEAGEGLRSQREMKVLLTGANGFVGSHIVDLLRARGMSVSVLLRPGSDRRFIASHLPHLDVRSGSISDVRSLEAAMDDATHVIHCAGSTKAVRASDLFEVNGAGTRNVVEAFNRRPGRLERLVHISSLAAGGPGTPAQPAREEDTPHPLSDYGKSKLAGEQEVLRGCPDRSVVLRPPAVYGPRDTAFMPFFKAIRNHLLPLFGGGRMPLSLVHVRDLAGAVLESLTHPAAVGKVFYAASPQPTTSRGLAEEIARQMDTWTLPLRMPIEAFWPVCAIQEAISRIWNRPSVLSRQKYADLRAPGWVCDAGRLKRDLGYVCATELGLGIAETLAWYRKEGWM